MRRVSAKIEQAGATHYGSPLTWGDGAPDDAVRRPSRWSIGAAAFDNAATGETRSYLCDPDHHRVHIAAADGQLIASFGRFGSEPGEFDTPSDVALVRVPFAGEDIGDDDLAGRLVAVADYGNDRVQLFEPDGVLFGVISGRHDDPVRVRRCFGARVFHIEAHPYLASPTRLSATGSVLSVRCPQREVIVDLEHALLLDYAMWADSPARAARKVSSWLR